MKISKNNKEPASMALYNATGKTITRRFPDRPLVLVYCHPKKAREMLTMLEHWDITLINQLVYRKFPTGKVSLFTLDPSINQFTKESADIVMDGFSADFITAHQGMFDMLILPDCDGVWGTASNRGETNSLIYIIKQLLSTLKPNGSLCVSKFIKVDIRTVADILIGEGYRVETVGDTIHAYLIITNPPFLGGRKRRTRKARKQFMSTTQN